MRTHYVTPGLLAFFLLSAMGWFIWNASSNQEQAEGTEGIAPQPAVAVGSGRAARSGASPFLATHEQGVAFTPDGENVAPSFHIEMEALKKRLETAPQDTTALIRLARLKQDGHQTEEAAAYYRRYLDARSDGRQAWLDLARCYAELARWQEALEATQTMLRRFPDDPAALYNLGAIYANTSRPDEARTTWQRVTRQERNPEMKAMAASALRRLDTIHP